MQLSGIFLRLAFRTNDQRRQSGTDHPVVQRNTFQLHFASHPSGCSRASDITSTSITWAACGLNLLLVSTQLRAACKCWKHINLRLSFLGFTWTRTDTKLRSPIRVTGRCGCDTRRCHAEICAQAGVWKRPSATVLSSLQCNVRLWRLSTMSTLSCVRVTALVQRCGPWSAVNSTFSVDSCTLLHADRLEEFRVASSVSRA